MHKTGKPVHRCHDCPLNLGKQCAIFDDPHAMWQKGKCSGYKNQELYERYQNDLQRHPPDPRKEKRRRATQLRQSEGHVSGQRRPGLRR